MMFCRAIVAPLVPRLKTLKGDLCRRQKRRLDQRVHLLEASPADLPVHQVQEGDVVHKRAVVCAVMQHTPAEVHFQEV